MSQPETSDVAALIHRLEVLEAREAARATRRRQAVRWLVAFALAMLFAAPLALAADGNCPNDYPFCFTADAPARANEVNHNFSQIKEWLETKVGAVTATGVTTGTVTATGAVINGNMNVTGSTSVGGNVTISGEVLLSASGRARMQAMGYCDCEFGSMTVDRTGAVVSAAVADNFLFENGQAATFQCRGGRFLVGIEKINASCLASVGCLEQYRCCRPCSFQRE